MAAKLSLGNIMPDVNELDLESLIEELRLEIRKELKIKEGAEKLQKASIDRKAKGNVATIVKNCNERLEQLRRSLTDLQAQVPGGDGESLLELRLRLVRWWETLEICDVLNNTQGVGKGAPQRERSSLYLAIARTDK